MARQNINPNPEEKLFEAYLDFSGGLNSETSNENLKDNEFPVMENVDLMSRGSARRRTGRTLIGQVTGTAQGIFWYYRQGQPEPDMIIAAGGRLYVKENGSQDITEVPITDNGQPFTFQTALPVEAVQYNTDLFIATGTKLVELTYNVADAKWEAKTVTPYMPTVMEAIYIGTNALADNPDAYIQDGTASQLEVVGIKPEKRTGAVNEPITMTAFINKPSGVTDVDYKWEYRRSGYSTWTLGKDFTKNEKTFSFKVDAAGSYDIQVTIRETGKTTPEVKYVLSSYIVNPTDMNKELPFTGIQKCRKILLHYDRILLTLDDANPYQVYISDLTNPRYFPVTNTISFDTGKQEPITAIIRYRNMLIVFTKTTIQTLTGTSPSDYRRSVIHDGLGCIASRSAQVVGNNVIFLSHEGIFLLKPNQFILEVMNVQRVDYPIKSEIRPKSNACAVTFNSQYWICFPDDKVIYRLYYDNGMWVKDKSSKLNIVEFLQYGEDVYNLTTDGKIYKHDDTVYTDDGEIYEMLIETKAYDLSASFNRKRIRRLYILAGHFGVNVDFETTVWADAAIVLSPDKGQATVDENGNVIWTQTTEPNFHYYAGTVFGQWLMGISPFGTVPVSVQRANLRGKCRRVKLRFRHKQANECEIFGFGIEFKLKKP